MRVKTLVNIMTGLGIQMNNVSNIGRRQKTQRLTSLDYRLSAVGYQLSAIGYELFAHYYLDTGLRRYDDGYGFFTITTQSPAEDKKDALRLYP